ncbi:unnamed protein product [Closterium sp. NIES-53]
MLLRRAEQVPVYFLGEPCYRPASCAALSTPAASFTLTAAAMSSCSAASSTPAASPTPATPAITSIRAAAVPDMEGRACSSIVTLGSDPAACGRRLCGAAGCERVEGDGVKFKNCSGCGKVAYCSRECQKAHWPSHKLTCPGRISGKRSGNDENKECGRKTDEESCCEGSAKRVGAGRCGDGG